MKIDRAGGRIIAEVKFPVEGRQTANLTLHVPSRLQLKIEPTSARTRVADVGAVELSNSRGKASSNKSRGVCRGVIAEASSESPMREA